MLNVTIEVPFEYLARVASLAEIARLQRMMEDLPPEIEWTWEQIPERMVQKVKFRGPACLVAPIQTELMNLITRTMPNRRH